MGVAADSHHSGDAETEVEWEIYNDDGFVHKRRRRLYDDSPPPTNDTTDAELRHRRRSQRLRCLLNLKEKYQRELQHWERLSATVENLAAPPPTTADSEPSALPDMTETADGDRYRELIDELVAQAEAQEVVLRKTSEMCQYVDLVCEEREEKLAKSIMDLPIWRNGVQLLASLQGNFGDEGGDVL